MSAWRIPANMERHVQMILVPTIVIALLVMLESIAKPVIVFHIIS